MAHPDESAVNRPPEVEEKLDQWMELRDQGRGVSPQELCAGKPKLEDELRSRIEAVLAVEALFGVGDADATQPANDRPRHLPSIPGYEVLSVLGTGATGIVYDARQVSPRRRCALKMMLAGEHARIADIDRFVRGATAAARLQNPNIVRIYTVGSHEGQPFLAMEFVGGGSLADRLSGDHWPPREAAEMIAGLASALTSAARAWHRASRSEAIQHPPDHCRYPEDLRLRSGQSPGP